MQSLLCPWRFVRATQEHSLRDCRGSLMLATSLESDHEFHAAHTICCSWVIKAFLSQSLPSSMTRAPSTRGHHRVTCLSVLPSPRMLLTTTVPTQVMTHNSGQSLLGEGRLESEISQYGLSHQKNKWTCTFGGSQAF